MLTSHDMKDVARIAERIVLIDQGAIRFDQAEVTVEDPPLEEVLATAFKGDA